MARGGSFSNRGDPYGAAFANAADKYGISELYLRKIATIESGGRPSAQNNSSRGLMQFQPAAAREVGLRNPFDPVASIEAAAKLAHKNQDYLSEKLGRPVKDWELYLAHQQGRYGAETLLKNPERPATSALAKFHDSPARAVIGNGGSRDMDCREFTALWQRRYEAARPLGKDIRVDRDFAQRAVEEREGRGLDRDRSARGTFNGASAHSEGHQESLRESFLRQERSAKPGSAFQESFKEAALPDGRRSDRSNEPQPVLPDAAPETVRQSPYHRDHFTPMGNS